MTTQWYDESKNHSHRLVYDMICALDKQQSIRNERNNRCLMMYGNYGIFSNDPANLLRGNNPVLPEQRVKINIVSSMCDTVSAKISQMRPRVTYLTSRGNYTSKSQAKKMTRFMDGMFYKNKVYDLHQAAFKDATIFDIGILRHYIDKDEQAVKSERCLPTEFLVDQADSIYGTPRCIYQVRKIRKDILVKRYPSKKNSIMMSSSAINDQSFKFQENTDDFCLVMETWCLPSSKNAGDGRHVVCTNSCTLVDEDYTKTYFPFTFLYWSKPVYGFFGESLAQRLMGNQIEINKMLRIIQKSFHLGSAFKVFLEYGSKVSKEHLNNDVGAIIYYAGTKPDYYVPQTVHPEYFQHLKFLIQSSYEEAGISQLSAQAKMPAGIDGGSGKAIREYNDLETERFVLISQMYEASFLQTAAIYYDLVKDMYEEGMDLQVQAQSKTFIESIKWSDLQIQDDEYVTRMYPTSQLPNTPAGRLAYVQELINSGMVDQEYARSLLDFPDIQGYNDLQQAAVDDLERVLNKIITKGEFETPEPFQNLKYGVKMFSLAYNMAKDEGISETRIDLIRRWISIANTMLPAAQPQQPAAPDQGPPQGPPAGMPPA